MFSFENDIDTGKVWLCINAYTIMSSLERFCVLKQKLSVIIIIYDACYCYFCISLDHGIVVTQPFLWSMIINCKECEVEHVSILILFPQLSIYYKRYFVWYLMPIMVVLLA